VSEPLMPPSACLFAVLLPVVLLFSRSGAPVLTSTSLGRPSSRQQLPNERGNTRKIRFE